MALTLLGTGSGEIASRVIRTVRSSGIRTLAVHYDAAALDLTAPIPEWGRVGPFGM